MAPNDRLTKVECLSIGHDRRTNSVSARGYDVLFREMYPEDYLADPIRECG